MTIYGGVKVLEFPADGPQYYINPNVVGSYNVVVDPGETAFLRVPAALARQTIVGQHLMIWNISAPGGGIIYVNDENGDLMNWVTGVFESAVPTADHAIDVDYNARLILTGVNPDIYVGFRRPSLY